MAANKMVYTNRTTAELEYGNNPTRQNSWMACIASKVFLGQRLSQSDPNRVFQSRWILRALNNTLLYINLEHALFGGGHSQEFHVKVASNVEEACELMKVGFEHVCRLDGKQVFRKRKQYEM